MLTGNDWTKFDIKHWESYPNAFTNSKELACLSLVDLQTLNWIFFLTSESDTNLFTGEVNFCKISVKAALGPCLILINDLELFPDYSTLFQTFMAAKLYRAKIWSTYSHCLCNSTFWQSSRRWYWEILMTSSTISLFYVPRVLCPPLLLRIIIPYCCS